MSRAYYRIVKVTKDQVFIEDLDCGKSVTNDAERVVAELLSAEAKGGKQIIYKDTQEEWGILEHDGNRFVGYSPYRGPLPGRSCV